MGESTDALLTYVRIIRHDPEGKSHHRTMEEDVQHDKVTQLFGILSTRTRGAVSSQLANVNKLTNLTLAPLQGAGQSLI